MIGLLDASLFILDVAEWNRDRHRCLRPMEAMSLHREWLLRYRVRLAWADEFFNGFPWNQPNIPGELRDFLNVLTQFYSRMLSNGLLLMLKEEAPPVLPVIAPDLLTADHITDFRDVWLRLLGMLICDTQAVAAGIGVMTWERAETERQNSLFIENAKEIAAVVDSLTLLQTEEDWQAFVSRYHRPDLSGRRIAVLGGERAAFERARQRLTDEYNAAECLRLPPAYEQHRTKQETLQKLSQIDLLVICTNRLQHTDTDQIDSEKLSCAIKRLHSDTTDQIVRTVIEHFLQMEDTPPSQ